MQIDKKLHLITRNLVSVSDPQKLRNIVAQRPLKVYWGIAPAGDICVDVMFPISKIADFLEAGCHVTVLIADMHACLGKSLEEERTQYYENCIMAMLKVSGALLHNLYFVRGSEFQLSNDYCRDVFRLSSEISLRDARDAAAALHADQARNPSLASAIYPVMQALDEHYLGADAQFGNYKQKDIFSFAEKCIPKVGWLSAIHLLGESVPPLATHRRGIDIADSPEMVRARIRDLACPTNRNNPLLFLCRGVLYPIGRHVTVRQRNREITEAETYSMLERLFLTGNVSPDSLRKGVADALSKVLEDVKQRLE